MCEIGGGIFQGTTGLISYIINDSQNSFKYVT